MPIPSWSVFKKDTQKKGLSGIVFKRGDIIKGVDDALKAYHKFSPKKSKVLNQRHQEVLVLNNLYMACLNWLGIKKGQIKTNRQVLNYDANNLKERRMTAIKSLANETLKELYARIVEYDMVQVDNMGVIKFNHKKALFKEQQQVAQQMNLGNRRQRNNVQGEHSYLGELKPMGQSYQHERTTYVNSGKKTNVAGSGVHAVHNNLIRKVNELNLPHMVELRNQRNQTFEQQQEARLKQYGVKGHLIDETIRLVATDANLLTLNDWQILDQIVASSGGNLGYTEIGRTQYFKRDERIRYIAVPDGNGLLRDFNNQLIDTNDNAVYAYAMDESGNLLMNESTNYDRDNYGHFNHSGFNAGKSVICAGTLVIKQGILNRITTNSGHYKPTRTNMHNCLLVLDSDKVSLQNTVVQCFMPNIGKYHMYRGSDLRDSEFCLPLAATCNDTWKMGDPTDENDPFNLRTK